MSLTATAPYWPIRAFTWRARCPPVEPDLPLPAPIVNLRGQSLDEFDWQFADGKCNCSTHGRAE
jgi:hypothetical protein